MCNTPVMWEVFKGSWKLGNLMAESLFATIFVDINIWYNYSDCVDVEIFS